MQADLLCICILNHISAGLLQEPTDQTSGSGLAVPLISPHTHTPDTEPASLISEEAGELFYVKHVSSCSRPLEKKFSVIIIHYLYKPHKQHFWRSVTVAGGERF